MYEVVDEQVLKGRTDSTRKFSSLKLVEIRCKTASDIPTPETNWAVGSVCFIFGTEEVKYLNEQGEWE